MKAHDFAPRTIGELLDDAIALVISNRRTLLPVAAVLVLPVAAAYSVVASFYLRSFVEFFSLASRAISSGTAAPTSPDTTMLVTAGLLQVLSLLFIVSKGAFDAALYANSASLLERRAVPLRPALAAGFKVLVPVVVVQFVVGWVAGFAGVVSLGIGSIILATLWSVAYPVVVLEGGIGNALARSFALVKRHFWRVLLITIAIGLLGAQFESALATPTIVRELVTGATNPAMLGQVAWGWKVFDGLAQGLAIALVLPFTTSATLLNYLDLRARDEGMDLIVRARGLLPA
jgi:hypothetical protein